MKTYYLILFIIILLICIIIITYNLLYKTNIEHFCKIPNYNNQAEPNNKMIQLNYTPQSNIITSSCDKYWKDWPVEYNNTLVDMEPIPINMAQIDLPSEKQFGNNKYNAGIMDFNKLTGLIADKLDFNILDKLETKLKSPVDNKPLNYEYELKYIIIKLNKDTWINRWSTYNPSVKMYFNYNDISSPIEEINILNLEFKKRCDYVQKELLNDEQLIKYGIILFDIFKYKIVFIQYMDDIPVYTVMITLYRESDLYMNSFSYIGYIKDNKIILTNIEFVGINSTDNFLLSSAYNKNEIKQEIINNNFTNKSEIEKDPSAIVKLTKDHLENYKIKNQYACFNLNYDPVLKNDYILPYYSRESCESSVDPYGRPKQYGVYDKPCQKDEECPFYKINKNYENEYGKCNNGKCELPLNMEPVGYHYYKTDKKKLPLCYNCETNDYQIDTLLDSCCEKQYTDNKYSFLNTPDYAFENDITKRKNYFESKYCKVNINTNKYDCSNIILDKS